LNKFSLYFSKTALRDLKKLPLNIQKRIVKGCERLKTHPFPDSSHIKKLKGYKNLYRLRIGDFRVVFKIGENKIFILTILSRQDFEKEL